MTFEEAIEKTVTLAVTAALKACVFPEPVEFYSPELIAKKLEVDEETVRRWCRKGEMQAYKFGRFTRIKHKDFVDFCSHNKMID